MNVLNDAPPCNKLMNKQDNGYQQKSIVSGTSDSEDNENVIELLSSDDESNTSSDIDIGKPF